MEMQPRKDLLHPNIQTLTQLCSFHKAKLRIAMQHENEKITVFNHNNT